jgi:hypothetical protein
VQNGAMRSSAARWENEQISGNMGNGAKRM